MELGGGRGGLGPQGAGEQQLWLPHPEPTLELGDPTGASSILHLFKHGSKEMVVLPPENI